MGTFNIHSELRRHVDHTQELLLIYEAGRISSLPLMEFTEDRAAFTARRDAVDKWLASILIIETPLQDEIPELQFTEEYSRKAVDNKDEINLDIKIANLRVKISYDRNTKMFKFADREAYDVSFSSFLYFIQVLNRFLEITDGRWHKRR